MIRQMEVANSFMLMEIFMKVNGKMTKRQEKAYIIIVMEPNTMDNGLMIFSMVKVSKHGLMVVSMKVGIQWVRRVGRENIHGKMVVFMMVIGLITRLQEKECIYGLMVDNMKANG